MQSSYHISNADQAADGNHAAPRPEEFNPPRGLLCPAPPLPSQPPQGTRSSLFHEPFPPGTRVELFRLVKPGDSENPAVEVPASDEYLLQILQLRQPPQPDRRWDGDDTEHADRWPVTISSSAFDEGWDTDWHDPLRPELQRREVNELIEKWVEYRFQQGLPVTLGHRRAGAALALLYFFEKEEGRALDKVGVDRVVWTWLLHGVEVQYEIFAENNRTTTEAPFVLHELRRERVGIARGNLRGLLPETILPWGMKGDLQDPDLFYSTFARAQQISRMRRRIEPAHNEYIEHILQYTIITPGAPADATTRMRDAIERWASGRREREEEIDIEGLRFVAGMAASVVLRGPAEAAEVCAAELWHRLTFDVDETFIAPSEYGTMPTRQEEEDSAEATIDLDSDGEVIEDEELF